MKKPKPENMMALIDDHLQEIERLRAEVEKLTADLKHEKFWCDYWFDKFNDRKDRLEAAEDEIEELKNKLKWTSLR